MGELVCFYDPKSYDDGSSSSWQGHLSHTDPRVGAKQSRTQTLLPCRMAGDSKRVRKQKLKEGGSTGPKARSDTDMRRTTVQCRWMLTRHYNHSRLDMVIYPWSPSRRGKCLAPSVEGTHPKRPVATLPCHTAKTRTPERKNLLTKDNTKRHTRNSISNNGTQKELGIKRSNLFF